MTFKCPNTDSNPQPRSHFIDRVCVKLISVFFFLLPLRELLCDLRCPQVKGQLGSLQIVHAERSERSASVSVCLGPKLTLTVKR